MNLRSAVNSLAIALAVLALAAMPCDAQPPFRGVHFNPQAKPDQPDFPWLLHYGDCRETVRIHLRDAVDTLHINLIDFFVLIPHTLAAPPKGPAAGQPVDEWANLTYLDNLAAFLDDCHALGVSAEIDLACNMWIPSTVDSEHHISASGVWPKADDTPWDESARWYRGVIEYVEKRVQHPEAIAMWCMMGNHQWGGAEPVLWDGMPDVIAHAERFVKEVWPVFHSSGKRPKAAPIMLPIFSASDFWSAQPPQARLSAFSNLKKWLVDDLALPPDYWAITSYPFCDPAPDGFYYLKAIIDILGRENASRLLYTDLKWHGFDNRDCILPIQADEGQTPCFAPQGLRERRGQSRSSMIEWQLRKAKEYGCAGYWVWAYQDSGSQHFGLRDASGAWRQDLVNAIRAEESSRP